MEKAFDILAEHYRPMVVCYLRALTGDAHLSEDLAQETLLVAYRRFEEFRRGENFGAWLRGIARRKASENRRVAIRRQMVFDSRVLEGMEEMYGLLDRPRSDASSAAWADRLEIILQCVRRLSDRLQEAVDGVYRRGLKLHEAAGELQTTKDVIAQRLNRARQQIRECVAAAQESS